MEERDAYQKINLLKANLQRVIKGKSGTIELTIAALLARGHLLIEDVPGVGKTTLAHSLARSINCTFQRIQFTSDMLPSDVLGVTVYNQSKDSFEFRPGPIFANIVLADEINRSTPKTQSALLEAMNDRQVSVEKATYELPRPFMLLATQNPIEYAGTFPLPESQLDRFTMCLKIGYPDRASEREIVVASAGRTAPEALSPVVDSKDIELMQRVAGKVRVEEDLVNYMLTIAGETRSNKAVRLGVSPRATMTLYSAAQALALVRGRAYCVPDDVKALLVPVFAHRILPAGHHLEDDTTQAESILEDIVKRVAIPV
jgi:MoxR-like ATPase